jgi:hypothetical protein
VSVILLSHATRPVRRDWVRRGAFSRVGFVFALSCKATDPSGESVQWLGFAPHSLGSIFDFSRVGFVFTIFCNNLILRNEPVLRGSYRGIWVRSSFSHWVRFRDFVQAVGLAPILMNAERSACRLGAWC